jgi:tetratricopeptide (TPR) repeat protein
MTPTLIPGPPPRPARRDRRIAALVVAVAGTAVLGYVVDRMPSRGVAAVVETPAATAAGAGFSTLPSAPTEQRPASGSSESASAPASSGTPRPRNAKADATARVLKAASDEIAAKRYDKAITTLHAARADIQHDPQSYLLMARALEGKADYETARDFYAAAIDRNTLLADAYFGFATSSEALGDLEAAIGGMRSFLHVQPDADPQKLKIVQARSAIWEWESKLGRGAWGPSKGIPPGFSEAELRRDGRGVGVKIPLPETLQSDGTMKYEIKHQDKFKIFKP